MSSSSCRPMIPTVSGTRGRASTTSVAPAARRAGRQRRRPAAAHPSAPGGGGPRWCGRRAARAGAAATRRCRRRPGSPPRRRAGCGPAPPRARPGVPVEAHRPARAEHQRDARRRARRTRRLPQVPGPRRVEHGGERARCPPGSWIHRRPGWSATGAARVLGAAGRRPHQALGLRRQDRRTAAGLDGVDQPAR